MFKKGIYIFSTLLVTGSLIYSDSFHSDTYESVLTRESKHKLENRLIDLVSTDEIVQQIRLGRTVLFVDAREKEEYEEQHISGATVMTLREVESANLDAYRSADLVVAYCVKDFRGFEVARALQRRGITNVSLIESHGLYGWKKARLPLAGRQTGLSDEQALQQVKTCLNGYCTEEMDESTTNTKT